MINSCYCISQVLPTPSLEVPRLLFKLLGKLFAGFFLLFISLFFPFLRFLGSSFQVDHHYRHMAIYSARLMSGLNFRKHQLSARSSWNAGTVNPNFQPLLSFVCAD